MNYGAKSINDIRDVTKLRVMKISREHLDAMNLDINKFSISRRKN
jgi:hypothetical protein